MLELHPNTQALLTDGASVVTATRQRAVAVRLAYAAGAVSAGQRVWRSPDVLAWRSWLEREWSRDGDLLERVLRPSEEWLLWREVGAQAVRDARPLFRDAMTEGLRRAATLVAEWEIPAAALHGLPGSETQVFSRALVAFERRCEEAGVTASMHLARRLAARARHGRALRFAGCAPLSAAQRRFGALSAVPLDRTARALLATADDPDHELELVADWALRHLTTDPSRRLLVVLPEAPARAAQLERILKGVLAPQEWSTFDVGEAAPVFAREGGNALLSYGRIAHALEALAVCVEPLEFDRVSRWLRAPFWADPSPAERARIELWLRSRGRNTLDARQLLEELRHAPALRAPGAAGLAARLRVALEALGRGTAAPRVWVDRFRAALEGLGWPGSSALTSADAQLLARFTELLRDFASLGFLAHELGVGEALTLLRELAARVAFEAATGDTPVTVTGALSDPVVGYHGIWVAGLQAHAWPPPAQPDPFVPWQLQRAAGIPQATAAGQLSSAHGALVAWRRAATELVVSYARQVDDAPGVPSPLLAGLDLKALATAGRTESYAARIRHAAAPEELVDERGPAWNRAAPLPAGTRSLELQNLCAFRAFAELRLGAVELEAPVRGIDRRLRGKLLHGALEKLWRELGGSDGLAQHSQPTLVRLIERQVRTAATEILEREAGEFKPRLNEREIRRAARLIGELCELERGRTPFVVEAVELERHVVLPAGTLDLRLDRVDRLEDGSRVILDYKSGRGGTQRWFDEPVSHPQLLAYLLAVDGDIAALATAHVARSGAEFRGVAARSGVLPKVGARAEPNGRSAPDWERQVVVWRAIATRLIERFVSGDAAVAPIEGACDHCHLHALCRIADDPSDE